MSPRTDCTTLIPSGVVSPVATNHAAKGSVFVNLKNAGNSRDWPSFLADGTPPPRAPSSISKSTCHQPCEVAQIQAWSLSNFSAGSGEFASLQGQIEHLPGEGG